MTTANLRIALGQPKINFSAVLALILLAVALVALLILEKLMIYTYPFWSGHPDLLKPPGCKIYR